MKQNKNNFVFLFILLLTSSHKFIAYAKRVTPRKADNIFLKILLKNEKIIKFDITPTESITREDFLEKRNALLEKARKLNHENRCNSIIARKPSTPELLLLKHIRLEGGYHDHDRYLPIPMRGEMQTRMHSR